MKHAYLAEAAVLFRKDAIELARRGEIEYSQRATEMAEWCEKHSPVNTVPERKLPRVA